MKSSRQFPVVWRSALLVVAVAGLTCLGASSVRILIGSDLLKPGTLEFDQSLAPEAEREIFRLLSMVSIVVVVSYPLTLAASVVFLATSPFKLRQHGWLLMSAILFYLFVPVEVFVAVLDVRMIYHEFFTTAENAVFRELFLARVGALAGAPLVAQLCYYTIIVLAVFQPLKREERHAP